MASEMGETYEGEQAIRNVLGDLMKMKEVTSSKKTDQEILQALVDNPVVQSLAKAHTAMIAKKIQPTSLEAVNLTHGIENQKSNGDNKEFQELENLLHSPHLMGLLKCHDAVAKKNELNLEQLHGTTNGSHSSHTCDVSAKAPRAIRMVGMYKKSWEPLGLTVVKENGQLKIARILRGSEIERKALLHVDDVILEVNGNPLKGDPKKLQQYLHNTTGSVVFKILPSYEENQPPKLLYIKCHIDYDPKEDKLIPCPEAGLSFKRGEILQVVEQNDADWWQAQRVNNKGEARGRAGLIPSQSYEEKRQAMEELKKRNFGNEKDKRKSKKRKSLRRMYSVAKNSTFDKHDIAVYEEVACIPPFSRKALVLLMQNQDIAQEICHEIVERNPGAYGIPTMKKDIEIPTTPDSKDGGNVSESLHSELSNFALNQELNSVREVMKSGKICIVISTPQQLKLLRTSEFMPYVIFVKYPDEDKDDSEDALLPSSDSVIERYYIQYIDSILNHTTTTATASALTEELDNCKTKHQWVPTSWVY